MRMFTEVGSRVAAHSTGVGKAMLAQLPPEHGPRALLARTGLDGVTERTITDLDGVRRGAARRWPEQGYALDDEEQEAGVRCVAVAVPGTGPPAGGLDLGTLVADDRRRGRPRSARLERAAQARSPTR